MFRTVRVEAQRGVVPTFSLKVVNAMVSKWSRFTYDRSRASESGLGPTPYRGYCLLMWECEGGCTLWLLLFNVLVISLLLFWVVDGCLAITCRLLHIPLTSFGRVRIPKYHHNVVP